MSEKSRKIEFEDIENVLSLGDSKVKKQKHNSKRRRGKKYQINFESDSHSNIAKVDEVVNFLCKNISKNESETSVETNPPVKIAKESPKEIGLCSRENCPDNIRPECAKHLPSTSTAGLSDLFKNLQMQATKNQIKSNNVTEFLNIDLLNTNLEPLPTGHLEKLNLDKCKMSPNDNLPKDVTSDALKEFLNLSLVSKYAENEIGLPGDSDSQHLMSQLEQNLYSSLSEVPENLKENNFTTPVKLKTKLLNSGLDKTLVRGEILEKKKFKKKKSKNQKEAADLAEESDGFDGNQKVFLNSELHQKKDGTETKMGNSSPQQSTKNRKRHHSSKSSNLHANKDTKFPKYLSMDELQSVSNFGVLMTGIIRINQKNYKEAYITAPDKGMDILIKGLKDRNRALEGDEVYFVLKPKEHYRTVDSADVQRTAVVVGIKTFNHNRGAIGTLNVIKNKNINYALFSPRDSKLPRIRIKKNNCPKGFLENSDDFKDKLYFAKISQWTDTRYADGDIVKEVGQVGDVEAETAALLLKYDLDVTPYSDSLKEFIPPLPFKISETEIKSREDLRKECVFTIDPATAVDLDDAVSCRKLSTGNYEVGVHISDVSYFLKEGNPLDQTVCQRATTVYLVQRAYHMLPYELCRLCSLTPGEDKLSFSVMWEITPECEIINHRFARTIINSCAQFSYEQVQSVIDGSSETVFPKMYGGHSKENAKEVISFLNKVAVKLRNKRFENGALKIDQKKIFFSLDDDLLPTTYRVETHEQSHQLIEEFMLLANITVAQKLSECFPKIAFLRSHSPPLTYILKKLQKSLEKYGIILDISTSDSLQASLLKYSGDDTESVARMLVLNNALAKPMARAKYYCSGLYTDEADRRHYALNVPLYTHFTSPIRRYADIMTHRLLAASLSYCDPPNWTVNFVQSIASNCNKQKYSAKMAGEMSTELFLSIYIGLQGVVVCEAVVCDIKDKSFDCIVLSTGAHQRLYFEHIKGELKQEKDDGVVRLTIKWPKDENHENEAIQIVEMFSIVKVELKRTNVLKIEASLLR